MCFREMIQATENRRPQSPNLGRDSLDAAVCQFLSGDNKPHGVSKPHVKDIQRRVQSWLLGQPQLGAFVG